ncbi:hypothetical protein [Spiroplasma sp. BIUS-1]|uniref:hypothetical protein n=1 Tax=Spiroplasma sp. BIUS-1 TaxID=216964 RepID=UPI0013995CF4|nr:hypothetical protein [Spiroplasma sp. BIUS-1]QHX36648.1 Holliday junction DNA helicase RuvA [Spiroplasma sp. BIUS-1]
MYYLIAKIKEIENELITVESNKVGYKGYKMFNTKVEIEDELTLYVINYKNEYINEFLFFNNKKLRDICEELLNIKNIGINTIRKLFLNLDYDEFILICKDQKVDELIKQTKLSELTCKKIIQEVRSKVFKVTYNTKQMNIINSLNKLGYKISDIYKSIETLDFKMSEDKIMQKALLNLNAYGN